MAMPMTTTGPHLVLPRVGTARDYSRETYGPQLADVATRLGTPLMPWQRHVVDVAFEVDPATGLLFYDEVDLTVPRQSGKTRILLAKMVWRCTMAARRLGPQTVTYTAQTRNAARRKLERDFAPALRRASKRSFVEVVGTRRLPRVPREWKLSMNNGSEHMYFGTQSYLQIEVPSPTATHGDTLDDGNIDEAFVHTDDSVEEAMRPAQATRLDAQLWVNSTAGDEKSVYLYGKVVAGRRAAEAGTTSSRVAYFEWSMPDDADIDDEHAWYGYMPALGHTITPAFIRGELDRARRRPEEGGEDLWRRAYGNQWVRVPMLAAVGLPPVVTAEQWLDLGHRDSAIVGRAVVGVAVSTDGSSASLVLVGRSTVGRIHVEVVACERGTTWVATTLAQLLRANRSIVGVAYPATVATKALEPDIHRAAGDRAATGLGSGEYAAACEGWVQAVAARSLVHVPQDWMLAAVAGAAKHTRGRLWEWQRITDAVDISPVEAGTAALRVFDLLPTATAYAPRRLR